MDATTPRSVLPRRRTGLGSLVVTLRFAMRDLRAGARGFGVFLACLAIGTGAIATVGSLARGMADGLAARGRVIVGGDISASLLQREATPAELAGLAALGRVAPVATLRAMARPPSGDAALVEVKAVGPGYPRLGVLGTEPAGPASRLLAERDGIYGAIVEPTFLARLDLKPGDTFTIGAERLRIAAVLISEPDTLATGIALGPRVILSRQALRASGLLQPGSLVRWSYRILLPPGRDGDGALAADIARIGAEFPQAGFDIRSRVNIAPQFQKNIARFTQFLALTGIVALLVGGVGVASAVNAFVERRRTTVAVLKSVGAGGGRAVAIMLCEVAALALAGIAIGLAAGAALPVLLVRLFGDLLPVPLMPGPFAGPLALAALFGALVAGAFSIWPLGRAHDVPASSLFRGPVATQRRRPRLRYMAAAAALAFLLVATAIGLAWDRYVATIAVVACAGAYALLRAVALAVAALARRLPAPRWPVARLAIANLHRPGAATASVVVSLGLGVTLVVALSAIDTTLTRALGVSLPERAPSFYFLDIPGAKADAFAALIDSVAPGAKQQRVPMLRGRFVALAGVPAGKVKARGDVAWVLEGDRGITYAATVPKGARVVEGRWWSKDYAGPPLVSMDRDIASGLGLKLGDTITVNVLGRDITAKIANLREIDWSSLAINFVMVFSPGTFAGAPVSDLATLTFKDGGTPREEGAAVKAVARAFPAVTTISVKEALSAIDSLVRKLLDAVRAASAASLASAVLVLAGALAAGRRLRLYDAVVLRTLGARRSTIRNVFLLEYALLGAVAAAFGLAAGSVIGAAVLKLAMKLDPVLDFGTLGLIAVAAVAATVALGALGNGRVLAQKPARRLREP